MSEETWEGMLARSLGPSSCDAGLPVTSCQGCDEGRCLIAGAPPCRPMVEKVDTGEWESWCRAHPLPNGDTGRVYDTHAEALADAFKHVEEHS